MTHDTTKLTEKTFLTSGQLAVLVPQAQKGDHRAINMVYEAFIPLIKNALSELKAFAILGEDAENIAWLKFWEAIMAYKDEDFASLPGLLKDKVRFALLKAMERTLKYRSRLIWDAKDASSTNHWEPGAIDARLEAIHYGAALRQGMGKLSSKQREIVLQTVVGDLSLKEYSEPAGICYSAAYRLQCRALRILKKYL